MEEKFKGFRYQYKKREMLSITRIQYNGTGRLGLVDSLKIWCQPKIHGLVWPPGGVNLAHGIFMMVKIRYFSTTLWPY